MKSIKEIVAPNIVKHRQRCGFSQKAFARAMKVSPNTVYLWEKGSTWPEADKFDQMAELFDVPVWEFFSGSAPSLDASLALVLEELGYDSSALKKKKKKAERRDS